MGLIKTAILTGGGIYAVNKIAKSAENRHNYPPPQNYPPQNYNPNYPPQGYWAPPPQGPPPQGQQRGYPPEGYYNNQPQGQWGPPPNGPQYDQRAYNDSRAPPGDRPYDPRGSSSNTPPAYSQQPQSYTNMPPQGEGYDKKDSAGPRPN